MSTDFILLILIAIFGVIGFFKGFIKSFGFLVAEILSILLASRLYLLAGTFFHTFIVNINISNVLGFLTVFAVLSICFRIIVEIIAKIFHLPIINFVNRILGLCFGVFEIIFVVGFTLSLLLKYPISVSLVKTITEKSVIAPIMIDISSVLTPLLPKVITDIQSIPGLDGLKDFPGLQEIPEIQNYIDSTTYGNTINYGINEPI